MLQYNTTPYIGILQWFSFIWEIPWENTTINPIPWVRETIGQQTSQKHLSGASPPNPKFIEKVYNKPRVQTQLNNIFGSGRLGSKTNNLPLGD